MCAALCIICAGALTQPEETPAVIAVRVPGPEIAQPLAVEAPKKAPEPMLMIRAAKAYEPEQEQILEKQGPEAPIYDIPLSQELQEYTFSVCIENGVDYEMVLAMIGAESSYRAEVVSKSNDYGLMQINISNHNSLRETLGVDDLLDPKQNILCGVYLLGKLAAKYDDPHRILMAYNMGEYGAKVYAESGNAESAYSRTVMDARAKLLQGKTS